MKGLKGNMGNISNNIQHNIKSKLVVGNKEYFFYDLNKIPQQDKFNKLPITIKILLENHLQNCENDFSLDLKKVNFQPRRVILQDFTGVPALVDLAAMRECISRLGGDTRLINPLRPVDLVVDHSIQVGHYGNEGALQFNTVEEFVRNKQRYSFLKWGQAAFSNFRLVPPESGIVHQVNLEYLANVIISHENQGETWLFPDTIVGTDSHTTMINGLGVLGWGVGGIEAEASMLGQPLNMLLPKVIGFSLTGSLREGVTATDLVLKITQILRQKGVVGKFVEFYGDGLKNLPLADRATISNMAPEYGATCGYFPIDQETLNYLELTGRDKQHIAVVEAYAKHQGLWNNPQNTIDYDGNISLDLADVETSIAGPRRPQDRIILSTAKDNFIEEVKKLPANFVDYDLINNKKSIEINNGAIVIAAITSCTNTSNPEVVLAAALLAKNAVERGLSVPAWVKTSLAPGSRVVTEYLNKAKLDKYLEKLGFFTVGYGCTTCIGNSGPLNPDISVQIKEKNLNVCSILSGNRNFEGRIHPDVKMNYLASPPLVVAYALVGHMNIDLYNEPIGKDKQGKDVYLKDIWPTHEEIKQITKKHLSSKLFTNSYQNLFVGNNNWEELKVINSELYGWDDSSTYVKKPPFFTNMTKESPTLEKNITKARVLAKLGDSITTDHISPAGIIKENSPAGKYLIQNGVSVRDFNSYGSRRGNHEVMMRGTFANLRLRNKLVPEVEGGMTKYFPTNEIMTIFDASMCYKEAKIPLLVIAGKEYGSGSSRDWAAKGPLLLGVKFVIAESFERIHRSNLVGMGILPLQFQENENADNLNLSGEEEFTLQGLNKLSVNGKLTIVAESANQKNKKFTVDVRIDTAQELEYYKNGGILQYVIRNLLN